LNAAGIALPTNEKPSLFQFAFKRHLRWLRRRLLNLQAVSLRRLLLAALMSS